LPVILSPSLLAILRKRSERRISRRFVAYGDSG
jgi:hypothetical protein